MHPTVLTIAGSDPTGGAGMQVDIKAMTAIGVYAGAVVTCITVQNSRGVSRVVPLDPELVADQIRAVLEDHHVTHIKTGMIGTAAIAEAVGNALKEFSGEVIVDPVLVATTGQKLFSAPDLSSLRTCLVARATVLTPNLPELSAITGINAKDPENALVAADALLDEFEGLRAVIVKGGHIEREDKVVTDLLLFRSQETVKLVSSSRPHVESRNTHGTGCVLASAFASYHALTGDDEKAFFLATGFIQQALERSRGVGIVKNPEGRGGLLLGPAVSD